MASRLEPQIPISKPAPFIPVVIKRPATNEPIAAALDKRTILYSSSIIGTWSPGPCITKRNLPFLCTPTNRASTAIMNQQARPRRQQTSRPKPLPPGDEDVSHDVILGEFQDVDTLTLSEASLVINALVAKRRNDRKGFQETEILAQTVDYLDAFARFKQKENVEAVERLLSSHKNLNKFERAQIGSLCCDSAEEAKTLIPSIANKIDDDVLQDLLDQMAKLQG
ncbi:hypothetical protein diail_3675 [Diaporthe ilicicola]|nr:hypothetical protein diail_3675 [Diaporthe ilicicola]